MARRAAIDRASMAQISMCVGIASFLLALTFRRVRREYRNRHRVSGRARALMGEQLPAHIAEHLARMGDPDYICLAIAENKLTVDPLLEKLAEVRSSSVWPPEAASATATADAATTATGTESESSTSDDCLADGSAAGAARAEVEVAAGGESSVSGETVDERERTKEQGTTFPPSPPPGTGAAIGYGYPWGAPWVRREIATMMEKRMFGRPVDPDKLCVAAGVTGVLRLLLVSLTEPGQGCLLPVPYFAGFDYALAMAGVKAWPVVGDSATGGVEGGVDVVISPRALQAGLREARAKAGQHEVRVLLLTSPHNPTGRLYSPKALLGAVAWARKRGLHVIVDEIYANTVHRLNASFRSLGGLLTADNGPGMGDDVHILYGPGKDLGVAGWRVGVLYSENEEVISAVRHMCHTCESSSDTLNLLGRLFQAPGFLDSYYRQSQEALRAAYLSVVHALGREGIMHLQAESGLFLMLDLREFLEDSSMESEARLWRQIVERAGVNLTPGNALHCPEPGWFRMCYAYQRVEVVSRAVERVAAMLRATVAERAQKSLAEHEEIKGVRRVQARGEQNTKPPPGLATPASSKTSSPFKAPSARLSAPTEQKLGIHGGNAVGAEQVSVGVNGRDDRAEGSGSAAAAAATGLIAAEGAGSGTISDNQGEGAVTAAATGLIAVEGAGSGTISDNQGEGAVTAAAIGRATSTASADSDTVASLADGGELSEPDDAKTPDGSVALSQSSDDTEAATADSETTSQSSDSVHVVARLTEAAEVAAGAAGAPLSSSSERSSASSSSTPLPALFNSPDALSVADTETDEEHNEALLAIGQAMAEAGQAALNVEDDAEVPPEVVPW